MKTPDKFNALFDRFLLGGVGCGLLVLCLMVGVFFVLWQNPPAAKPTSSAPAPVLVGPATLTPGPTPTPLFQFASPTLLPPGFETLTLTPVQSGTLTSTSQISSPVPQ